MSVRRLVVQKRTVSPIREVRERAPNNTEKAKMGVMDKLTEMYDIEGFESE